MRKNIKGNSKYENAKEALITLMSTFKSEIWPIVAAWQENEKSAYTTISWNNPQEFDAEITFYGDAPGMYIMSDVGAYYIYLPKTTKAYRAYKTAMFDLHKDDDDLYEESIPSMFCIYFDGKSRVEFKFVSYLFDVNDRDQFHLVLQSSREISREVEEMLSKSEFSWRYEGDANPGGEKTYKVGGEIPTDYYVGIKSCYEYNND